ncbi:hypothetical protein CEXT_156941 [Caerostris extrusa]|uniref:Uncharacterized protein n=1 Tax=Caerostris extrusa TaxID=172846 RepID=A0AAV4P262_CAEEX|nr:hypothetical protein CEXT_156941 [Caerostris extrusa]
MRSSGNGRNDRRDRCRETLHIQMRPHSFPRAEPGGEKRGRCGSMRPKKRIPQQLRTTSSAQRNASSLPIRIAEKEKKKKSR